MVWVQNLQEIDRSLRDPLFYRKLIKQNTHAQPMNDVINSAHIARSGTVTVKSSHRDIKALCPLKLLGV